MEVARNQGKPILTKEPKETKEPNKPKEPKEQEQAHGPDSVPWLLAGDDAVLEHADAFDLGLD